MPKHVPMPIAAALAGLLIAAAPAAASSGETLSLRLAGPAVAGGVTDFVASGVDSDESIGGYNLDVFAKPKALDPTCAPTDDGEQQSWMADMSHEFHPVVGLVETIDPGSFSLTFKDNFPQPGTQLLCAYTVGMGTAATASLTVDVKPAGGGGGATPAARPSVLRRPRVVRSGRRLVCRRGSWSGATRFSYRWLVSGHVRAHAHGRRLRITRAIRARAVMCAVRGSNAAGATTALSRAIRVR
jgi:hypothetical protein